MTRMYNAQMARLAVAVVAASLCLVVSGPTEANAASAHVGDAVYRDGVAIIEWHATIMDDPHYNATSLPVIHHLGNGNVRSGSWSDFLAGKKYQGVYRPKTAPSPAARDNFKYMARKLKDDKIPYTLLDLLFYNENMSGTWVDSAEIVSIRCDGVVEYVYEWYGFRVSGNDTYWDITRSGRWNRELHGGTAVTPKKQARQNLYKVSSSLP